MTEGSGTRRAGTRLFLGVAVIVLLVVGWFTGCDAVNAFAATHGHGVEGTFTPFAHTCHTNRSHGRHGSFDLPHCSWSGTFVSDDGSIEDLDVTVGTSTGDPARASYARVVPRSRGTVLVEPDTWGTKALKFACVLLILGAGLGIAIYRRHLRKSAEAARERARRRVAEARPRQPHERLARAAANLQGRPPSSSGVHPPVDPPRRDVHPGG